MTKVGMKPEKWVEEIEKEKKYRLCQSLSNNINIPFVNEQTAINTCMNFEREHGELPSKSELEALLINEAFRKDYNEKSTSYKEKMNQPNLEKLKLSIKNLGFSTKEDTFEEILDIFLNKKMMTRVCKAITDPIEDEDKRVKMIKKCMEEMEDLKGDEEWKWDVLKEYIKFHKDSIMSCSTEVRITDDPLKKDEKFNACMKKNFFSFLYELLYNTASTFNPIRDEIPVNESKLYAVKKGAFAEDFFLPSLKYWANKNSYSYMSPAFFYEGKIYEKSPGVKSRAGVPRLEFVFYKSPEEMYGIDLTTSRSADSIKNHWELARYHPNLKKYFVVVVSNAFSPEIFKRWNKKIEEDEEYKGKVEVIHYKDINKILDQLSEKGFNFKLINGDIAKESLMNIEESKSGQGKLKKLESALITVLKNYRTEKYSPSLKRPKSFANLSS